MGQNSSKRGGGNASSSDPPHGKKKGRATTATAATATTASSPGVSGASRTNLQQPSRAGARRKSMLVAAHSRDAEAAADMVATAGAEAVGETDELGRTPLHIACMEPPSRLRGGTGLNAGLTSGGHRASTSAAPSLSPFPGAAGNRGSLPPVPHRSVGRVRGSVVNRSSRRITSSPTFRLVLSLGGGQHGRALIDTEDASRGGSKEGGGRTPLGHACLAGNTEAVCALLTLGADVGKADTEGKTPLHHAARGGSAQITQLLLEHVTEENAGSREHRSRRVSSIDLLQRRDSLGRTPLHWAAIHGHIEVIHLLIEHGSPVSPLSDGGWSPAHRAALNNQCDAVGVLLDWGHPPSMPDARGDTILTYPSAEIWIRGALRRADVHRRRRRRALAMGLLGAGFEARELEECWPKDDDKDGAGGTAGGNDEQGSGSLNGNNLNHRSSAAAAILTRNAAALSAPLGRISRVSVSGEREVWFDADSGSLDNDDDAVNSNANAISNGRGDVNDATATATDPADDGGTYLGPVTVAVASGERVESTGQVLQHSMVFRELLSAELVRPAPAPQPVLEMTPLDKQELESTLALMASLAAARLEHPPIEAANAALCHIDNWLDLVAVIRPASYLDARDLLEAVRWRLNSATSTLHGISHRTGPGWIPRSTADSILLAFGISDALSLMAELELMHKHEFLRDPHPLRLLDHYGFTIEDVPEEYAYLFGNPPPEKK